MRPEKRGVLRPEDSISRLTARLRSQALYDAVLICTPPLLLVLYAFGTVHTLDLISPPVLLLLAGFSLGFLALSGVLIYRPKVPVTPAVARLLDEKTEAKDRFVTLATIDPQSASPLLIDRLRLEAGGFARRLVMDRDFPYRIKRGFYHSLVASVTAALLLHLFLPTVQSSIRMSPAAVHERLRELAHRMQARPRLADTGGRLEKLINKLQDPGMTKQEQQKLVQEMRQKIDAQQKQEPEQADRNMLGQTSSTLKSLEEQSGTGQEQAPEKSQGGGGNIQSNLPQESQGEKKQSPGNGSDSGGEKTAEADSQMQQGNSAQGDPTGKETKSKQQGTNQQAKGSDQNSQGDPDKQQTQKSNETAGKNESKSENPGGKNPASEERPQGQPPTDRFGGDGKGGLKGERYVTVQLPDDPAADTKAEAKTGNAKGGRSRVNLPASNLPLPAHVPDAPKEVQQMPLEYRGLIR